MGRKSLGNILASILEQKNLGLDKIDTHISNKYSAGWQSPKDFFRVSQLFYCPRWAFFDRAGVPSRNTSDNILKMEVGTFLHKVIQDALTALDIGYQFAETHLEVKELSLCGHPDGIIVPASQLVEIKTVGSNQARNFKSSGIPDYYVRQANAYCMMINTAAETDNRFYGINIDTIRFIVLNREDCKWVNVEPVGIDMGIQMDIIDKLELYKGLWKKGKILDDSAGLAKCDKCQNKSICHSTEILADILPGGKLREDSKRRERG